MNQTAFAAAVKTFYDTRLLTAVPGLQFMLFNEPWLIKLEETMNTVGRDVWGFVFSAGAVRAGALKQAKFHRSRIVFWKKEKAKAEKKAGKITTRKVAVTGGYRDERSIDSKAMIRLAEAEAKLANHEASAKSYEQWAKLLVKRPSQAFDVTLNDAVYFGLV